MAITTFDKNGRLNLKQNQVFQLHRLTLIILGETGIKLRYGTLQQLSELLTFAHSPGARISTTNLTWLGLRFLIHDERCPSKDFQLMGATSVFDSFTEKFMGFMQSDYLHNLTGPEFQQLADRFAKVLHSQPFGSTHETALDLFQDIFDVAKPLNLRVPYDELIAVTDRVLPGSKSLTQERPGAVINAFSRWRADVYRMAAMAREEFDPPVFNSAWIEAVWRAMDAKPAPVRVHQVDDGRWMVSEYGQDLKTRRLGMGKSFEEALCGLALPSSDWLHDLNPEDTIAAYTFYQPKLEVYFFQGEYLQSLRKLSVAFYQKASRQADS